MADRLERVNDRLGARVMASLTYCVDHPIPKEGVNGLMIRAEMHGNEWFM